MPPAEPETLHSLIMGRYIGTTFRATYYRGTATRFAYYLATTMAEAERIAKVYCNPGEVVFRVKAWEG